MRHARQISARHGVIAAGVIALAACVSAPAGTQVYKLYPGPARPPEAIAIIRLEPAVSARIDGLLASGVEWSEVHVAEGAHKLEFYSGDDCTLYEKRVVLLAGQTYRVKSRPRVLSACTGRLLDDASREVVTW